MPWKIKTMKTRYLLYPALTGLVAAVLMLLAISASATSADWLQARLFIPGQVLAALVFPHTAESAASPLRFFVEFALNFAVTWIGLLFVVVFLDRLCGTLYELTKN
jgi:hypothetical protein